MKLIVVIRCITIYRKRKKGMTKIAIFRKVWDKYGKVDCEQGCRLPALKQKPWEDITKLGN